MVTKSVLLLAVLASAATATVSAGTPQSEFLMDGFIDGLKDKAGNKHRLHPKPNATKAPAHTWMRDHVNTQLAAFARRVEPTVQTNPAGLQDRADSPAPAPKIVGGTPVSSTSKINVFQVALLDASVPVDANAFFCGGSLYNGQYIVTAAHCSDFLTSPSQVAVLVGSRTLSTTGAGNRVRVTRIKIHPDWNAYTYDNDVAVWTLERALTSPASAVLAARGSDPAGSSVNTVSGWGDTESTPRYPTQLQSVNLNVLARATCNSDANWGGSVTSTMYCLAAPGKSSCFGDSGGPATTNSSSTTPWNTLHGIVSWGSGEGCTTLPGVYTRVGNPVIYDFIVAAAQDPAKSWYQASKSATVAAGSTTTQASPTCPASRPTATACQASSSAARVVGEAYPAIGSTTGGAAASSCSCIFKNVGTASATSTVKCAAFCTALT